MPRLVHKIDRFNRSDDLVGNTYHSAWLIRHLFLLPVELIDIQLPNGNIKTIVSHEPPTRTIYDQRTRKSWYSHGRYTYRDR